MAAKREGFFGTDNLHRAGWTVALGLAGFVGALIYQRTFGPPKVIVDSAATTIQTTSAPSSTIQSSSQSSDVKELADAVRQLAKGSQSSPDRERLRQLSAEVDRLRAQISKQTLGASSGQNGPNSTIKSVGVPASGADGFQLPKNVSGYTQADIFGVRALTCPPPRMERGARIAASFELTDGSLIQTATPIRTVIVQDRPNENLLQVDEAWGDLREGTNTILLSPQLPNGNYTLTFGFYLRNGLSAKYPRFYAHDCKFLII